MIIEKTFSERTHWDLSSALDSDRPFATIDPGAQGAVTMYRFLDRWDVSGLLCPPHKATALRHLDLCLDQALELGVRNFIVECQFVGASGRAAIALANRAAWLPVLVAGATREDVRIVWVYPATWHAMIRRRFAWQPSKKGQKFKTEDAKPLALQLAKQIAGTGSLFDNSKEQNQGFGDSIAMAQWAADVLWGAS